MRSPVRRPVLAVLSLLLVVGLAAPAAHAASDATSVSADAIASAEKLALTLTNKRRASAGLVNLRADGRLFELARERAQYMADTEEFSHTQSDGTTVFDLIGANDIAWYGAGEIIAWNTASLLDYSAEYAVSGWMGSPSHRAIVMSKDYNYVGFGLAISPSSGKRYWAGVYLKGPDRTGAIANIIKVSKSSYTSTRVKVTIDWSGKDARLQVLTSGLRYYQAQRRIAGGEWASYDPTTTSIIARNWTRGQTYEFRVRARDRAGNWGAWDQVTIRT